MTWFERLSALDAMFLYVEDRTAHMHVGAVMVFDGPAPSREALAARVGSRLALAPRWRQRLAEVPLGAGRPVWVDDARFDLARHLHRAALPAPGGEAELDALAARLFGERLDRDRPLWELWLVEGLRDGRFALLSKTHHCTIDGVAGADLTGALCDDPGGEHDAQASPAARPWTPRPAPAAGALLAASLADPLVRPLRALWGALAGPGPERAELLELAAGARPLLALTGLHRASASPVNRPIGARRAWATASLDLGEVKAVRARLGCTVNDVVLALVAGALRAALLARGAAGAASVELRALVPVSLRAPDGRGAAGNRVSAVLCPLPVGEPDPARRVERVAGAMRQAKASGQALGARLWVTLGELTPAPLLAGIARWQAARPYMNLVVTNVPGPQRPLFLLERRMRAWYPLVPLSRRQTLGVAVQSYDGRLGFGLLGDAEAAGDVAALARAVPPALAELGALAGRSAAG